MKKTINNSVRTAVFIIILFVFVGIGPSIKHFDGSYSYDNEPFEISPAITDEAGKNEPVVYKKEEIEIDGKPQVVHFLELDLSNSEVSVFPVLAKDKIFGFELLSGVDKRYNALATVNAGFNYSYGQPSGFVVSNGRILTGSLGYGRILLITNNKARFVDAPAEVRIECGGEQIFIDRVNPYPAEQGVSIYTSEYGPTDRFDKRHTVCVVRNGKVVSSGIADAEAEIPDDGYLIVDSKTENSVLSGFNTGHEVKIRWIDQAEQGYQCSGSLVENGVNVAKDTDPWAGSMEIPTPRTAVGIKDESTLVFIVVDGRQPGYSTGVTGKQLADILISAGVTEAALLDGGASSEMIVNGEIVNKPSAGKERLIASAFVITRN
ncbi:MAG: phosphodiester glycosidase family protein [Clostridiaceae bacterium]|jgi:exopolysaccharide biosynthesis protein|nr:phosphodiester glycosidase family protein [Clostridiaceae bacterium]